ncbi:GFA family protein [Streptomyces sp. AC495_CC817]|uniref:GFA family protein n=1 Tax=Streptomyces sp. AC495_CC817 TaxID=2823900 RepID=UPI001C27E6CD|nr:GFA family protein [Streptomyces sp. AC495_CC817]
MTDDRPRAAGARTIPTHGSCHCGGVEFEVLLGSSVLITLCTCGICFMSGHQEILVPEEEFTLLRGADHLKPYRFGVRIADHTFCVVCGIMPFYRPRSHPEGFFSVNARCLDLSGVSERTYVEFDGRDWEASMAANSHRTNVDPMAADDSMMRRG